MTEPIPDYDERPVHETDSAGHDPEVAPLDPDAELLRPTDEIEVVLDDEG